MKLSIITVNLNNLEGLKKTYESVVCQTFTDYEWLVIDGGSTDGSREFIEQHQDKFSYWCSEPDKGIYNAMNKGIVRAKGEYLNFMNSGDCFACEDTLAEVFGKLRTADILYGFVIMGWKKRQLCRNRTQKPRLYWYDLYLDSIPHQGAFIKQAMFTTVGFYDEQFKIFADWKWFVIAITHYNASYEFIPIKVAIMQDGGISQSGNGMLEINRIKKTLFPNYLMKEDVLNLCKIAIIQSNPLTRFLFRIVMIVSIQIIDLKKHCMKYYKYT